MTLSVILLGIIFILIDVIIFLLNSKPLTDEEEFEANRKVISYKINEIFK
jgi:hypothetical protein